MALPILLIFTLLFVLSNRGASLPTKVLIAADHEIDNQIEHSNSPKVFPRSIARDGHLIELGRRNQLNNKVISLSKTKCTPEHIGRLIIEPSQKVTPSISIIKCTRASHSVLKTITTKSIPKDHRFLLSSKAIVSIDHDDSSMKRLSLYSKAIVPIDHDDSSFKRHHKLLISKDHQSHLLSTDQRNNNNNNNNNNDHNLAHDFDSKIHQKMMMSDIGCKLDPPWTTPWMTLCLNDPTKMTCQPSFVISTSLYEPSKNPSMTHFAKYPKHSKAVPRYLTTQKSQQRHIAHLTETPHYFQRNRAKLNNSQPGAFEPASLIDPSILRPPPSSFKTTQNSVGRCTSTLQTSPRYVRSYAYASIRFKHRQAKHRLKPTFKSSIRFKPIHIHASPSSSLVQSYYTAIWFKSCYTWFKSLSSRYIKSPRCVKILFKSLLPVVSVSLLLTWLLPLVSVAKLLASPSLSCLPNCVPLVSGTSLDGEVLPKYLASKYKDHHSLSDPTSRLITKPPIFHQAIESSSALNTLQGSKLRSRSIFQLCSSKRKLSQSYYFELVPSFQTGTVSVPIWNRTIHPFIQCYESRNAIVPDKRGRSFGRSTPSELPWFPTANRLRRFDESIFLLQWNHHYPSVRHYLQCYFQCFTQLADPPIDSMPHPELRFYYTWCAQSADPSSDSRPRPELRFYSTWFSPCDNCYSSPETWCLLCCCSPETWYLHSRCRKHVSIAHYQSIQAHLVIFGQGRLHELRSISVGSRKLSAQSSKSKPLHVYSWALHCSGSCAQEKAHPHLQIDHNLLMDHSTKESISMAHPMIHTPILCCKNEQQDVSTNQNEPQRQGAFSPQLLLLRRSNRRRDPSVVSCSNMNAIVVLSIPQEQMFKQGSRIRHEITHLPKISRQAQRTAKQQAQIWSHSMPRQGVSAFPSSQSTMHGLVETRHPFPSRSENFHLRMLSPTAKDIGKVNLIDCQFQERSCSHESWPTKALCLPLPSNHTDRSIQTSTIVKQRSRPIMQGSNVLSVLQGSRNWFPTMQGRNGTSSLPYEHEQNQDHSDVSVETTIFVVRLQVRAVPLLLLRTQSWPPSSHWKSYQCQQRVAQQPTNILDETRPSNVKPPLLPSDKSPELHGRRRSKFFSRSVTIQCCHQQCRSSKLFTPASDGQPTPISTSTLTGESTIIPDPKHAHLTLKRLPQAILLDSTSAGPNVQCYHQHAYESSIPTIMPAPSIAIPLDPLRSLARSYDIAQRHCGIQPLQFFIKLLHFYTHCFMPDNPWNHFRQDLIIYPSIWSYLQCYAQSVDPSVDSMLRPELRFSSTRHYNSYDYHFLGYLLHLINATNGCVHSYSPNGFALASKEHPVYSRRNHRNERSSITAPPLVQLCPSQAFIVLVLDPLQGRNLQSTLAMLNALTSVPINQFNPNMSTPVMQGSNLKQGSLIAASIQQWSGAHREPSWHLVNAPITQGSQPQFSPASSAASIQPCQCQGSPHYISCASARTCSKIPTEPPWILPADPFKQGSHTGFFLACSNSSKAQALVTKGRPLNGILSAKSSPQGSRLPSAPPEPPWSFLSPTATIALPTDKQGSQSCSTSGYALGNQGSHTQFTANQGSQSSYASTYSSDTSSFILVQHGNLNCLKQGTEAGNPLNGILSLKIAAPRYEKPSSASFSSMVHNGIIPAAVHKGNNLSTGTIPVTVHKGANLSTEAPINAKLSSSSVSTKSIPHSAVSLGHLSFAETDPIWFLPASCPLLSLCFLTFIVCQLLTAFDWFSVDTSMVQQGSNFVEPLCSWPTAQVTQGSHIWSLIALPNGSTPCSLASSSTPTKDTANPKLSWVSTSVNAFALVKQGSFNASNEAPIPCLAVCKEASALSPSKGAMADANAIAVPQVAPSFKAIRAATQSSLLMKHPLLALIRNPVSSSILSASLIGRATSATAPVSKGTLPLVSKGAHAVAFKGATSKGASTVGSLLNGPDKVPSPDPPWLAFCRVAPITPTVNTLVPRKATGTAISFPIFNITGFIALLCPSEPGSRGDSTDLTTSAATSPAMAACQDLTSHFNVSCFATELSSKDSICNGVIAVDSSVPTISALVSTATPDLQQTSLSAASLSNSKPRCCTRTLRAPLFSFAALSAPPWCSHLTHDQSFVNQQTLHSTHSSVIFVSSLLTACFNLTHGGSAWHFIIQWLSHQALQGSHRAWHHSVQSPQGMTPQRQTGSAASGQSKSKASPLQVSMMHPCRPTVALTKQVPAPDLINQKPRLSTINMTSKGAIPPALNLNCSQPLDATQYPSWNPLAMQLQLSASDLSSHQSQSRTFNWFAFGLLLFTSLIVCHRFHNTKHHKSSQHSSIARECEDNLMINLRMVGLLFGCLMASCSMLVKQERPACSSAEFHSSHCLCLFKCRPALSSLVIYSSHYL